MDNQSVNKLHPIVIQCQRKEPLPPAVPTARYNIRLYRHEVKVAFEATDNYLEAFDDIMASHDLAYIKKIKEYLFWLSTAHDVTNATLNPRQVGLLVMMITYYIGAIGEVESDAYIATLENLMYGLMGLPFAKCYENNVLQAAANDEVL